MKKLERELLERNVSNIRVADWSLKPYWSGNTLLDLHLRGFQDLLSLRKNENWLWNYVMVISETDFPIK